MSPIQVKIKRVRTVSPPLPFPEYQTPQSAGVDLMADMDEPILLEPGERKLIPTGISIELPQGYEAQIRPRSGLALNKGIGLVNSPGTIDADYRGEIKIILINWGKESVVFKRGDRIAQMIIAPVIQAHLVEVDELQDSKRASGGFGSTGS